MFHAWIPTSRDGEVKTLIIRGELDSVSHQELLTGATYIADGGLDKTEYQTKPIEKQDLSRPAPCV